MLQPATQYPLTSTYVTKMDLDTVYAQSTRRFLGSMGFNPSIPRIAVYVPMQLLRHVRAGTTVGKLFEIDITWLQRWWGIGQCILEKPGSEIPPTSSKYLTSIRYFLARSNVLIEITQKRRLLGERNCYIMNHILRSNMSRKKIKTVNKVRLYLQIETLAEIATWRHERRSEVAQGGIQTFMVHTEIAKSQPTIQNDVERLEISSADVHPGG